MKKRLLRMTMTAALLGSMTTAVLANPVTDADDTAYVTLTAAADHAKAKAEAPKADELAPLAMKEFKLADGKARPETVALFRYLSALPKAGKVIYGHENDAHHKMFRPEGGSNSDTKDITGTYAGLIGFDSLSFTGDELRLTDVEANQGITHVQRMAEITGEAAEEGAIITLSMHMPNFDIAAKKQKADGRVDFSNYSAHITEGNVVNRILPNGDLNGLFNQYLDNVADYAHRMEEKNVSIIYRPFHEHNGFWFWWGKEHCYAKDFQDLWVYTVKYLRDTKQVHNMLYAYSPNGPFDNAAAYMDRYPGDAYVDIMGIDSYDDDQSGQWYKNMEMSLDVISKVAEKHKKIVAITEAGVRDGGSLAVSGNKDKQWFSKVADIAVKHGAAYFMTWSNFEKLPHNFFAPYMVSKTKGHEMINEFVDFYNMPETIFADGITDFTSLSK